MSEILNHTELKYLLIDSLKYYSEDSIYISGNNPYCFSINKKIFYIFIRNVHDSGSGRPNKDECRIQFSSTANFNSAKQSGLPVLFLGYYLKNNVFTAWEPYSKIERINRRGNVSVYSRFSIQERAANEGIAMYRDDSSQVIISFKPEYLGLYLENFEKMHQADEATLLELIKEANNAEPTETEVEGTVSAGREKFVVTHRKFRRDPGFRVAVYEAYDERCAMCGIQLELVIAAHIIPHSHDKGSEDPTNGLCLCSLHHDAYDNGLVFIDEKYNIKINDEKAKYLTKVKKDGGIKKFIDLQFEKIELPRSRTVYPSIEFIKIANHIRGIKE